MPFDASKYLGKQKKKRTCKDFFRYKYLKHKRYCKEQYKKYDAEQKYQDKLKEKLRAENNFDSKTNNSNFLVGLCKLILGLFLFCIVFIMFTFVFDWYETNYKYSIAMPKIAGYFIEHNDSFSASGLYTISRNEKDEGEKSASLLYGTIDCYYKEKYCKEEVVSIMNFGGIMILPHIWEYDIIYRDKDRLIYSDGYKTSVVVDLNQKTITRTIKKTFLQEKPKNQIDEFITDSAEIYKEEKRVIRKHLKRKLGW